MAQSTFAPRRQQSAATSSRTTNPNRLTKFEKTVLDNLIIMIKVRGPSVSETVNEWSRREIEGARNLAVLCLSNLHRDSKAARAIVDRECPNPYLKNVAGEVVSLAPPPPPAQVRCLRCDGLGGETFDRFSPCPSCNGTGKVPSTATATAAATQPNQAT